MLKRVTLSDIDSKLDKIIRAQKTLQQTDTRMLTKEAKQLSSIEKLEKIQREIEKAVEPHPLRKLTLRDLAQGTIGAFIGVTAHFTFIYGVKVAEKISMTRAIMLFPLSLLIGALFLYGTGFRRVPAKYLWYLPLRLLALFTVSVLMAILVLFVFQPYFLDNFQESFKQVATVSLMGLIGAITGDLIGKE
jgi:uncharacterized membrane protein